MSLSCGCVYACVYDSQVYSCPFYVLKLRTYKDDASFSSET